LTEGHFQAAGNGHVGPQEAYSSDLGRLLGLGGERRGEEDRTRASEERATVYRWVPGNQIGSMWALLPGWAGV